MDIIVIIWQLQVLQVMLLGRLLVVSLKEQDLVVVVVMLPILTP
jgi:hypothetical protein